MPTETLTYNMPSLPAAGSEQKTARFDEAYALLCIAIAAGIEKLQSRDGTMVIDRNGTHSTHVVVEEHGVVLSEATVEGEEGKLALCKVLEVITPQFAEAKSRAEMHQFWNEAEAACMVYRLTLNTKT